MRIWRRFSTILLTIVMLSFSFPVIVSANGPVPVWWYDVHLTNLPEGTAYVDLLIPLSEDDPAYTKLEEENLPEDFSVQSEIVTYHEDGFRSYTFHYQDALSMIAVHSEQQVSFFAKNEYYYKESNYRYGHFEDIEQRGKIRLALLDETGNIIKVSPTFPVTSSNPFAFLAGYCYYDAASDHWEMDMVTSNSGIFLYLLLSVCGIIFTCLIERIAAWPFGLGKNYGWTVVGTNIVSQLLMRTGFLLFYGLIFRKYVFAVTLLEILVYVGEFLYYRKRMQNIPQKKVLLYTITANTASLIICYRLNLMLLFH